MATDYGPPPMPLAYDPEAGIDYGIQYDPAAGLATMPIPYDAPAGMVAPPMGPQFGSGPSIGSSGGYNPETGERYTTQFRYTPVTAPQGGGMGELGLQQLMQMFYPPPPQPRGPTPYWEDPQTYYGQQPQIDPIAQAKAATMAAQKFIAFRGYQNDLKEGVSAQDAMARWAPMLFQDTSVAPVLKSMQPAATYKFNDATRAYEPKGGVGRPYFQPASSARLPDVGLDENVKMIGNQRVYQNPRTGAITKLDSDDKVGALDLVDYRNASTQIAEANKTLMDQYASPSARAAATNVINQAQETIKGVRGVKAAATAMKAPETPISITTQAEFDNLPSGAIYLNKGKRHRKP